MARGNNKGSGLKVNTKEESFRPAKLPYKVEVINPAERRESIAKVVKAIKLVMSDQSIDKAIYIGAQARWMGPFSNPAAPNRTRDDALITKVFVGPQGRKIFEVYDDNMDKYPKRTPFYVTENPGEGNPMSMVRGAVVGDSSLVPPEGWTARDVTPEDFPKGALITRKDIA